MKFCYDIYMWWGSSYDICHNNQWDNGFQKKCFLLMIFLKLIIFFIFNKQIKIGINKQIKID